jgi:hypothetical protein
MTSQMSSRRVFPIGRAVNVPDYGVITVFGVLNGPESAFLLLGELRSWEEVTAEPLPLRSLEITDNRDRDYQSVGGGMGGGGVPGQPTWTFGSHGFKPPLADDTQVLWLRRAIWDGRPPGREVALLLSGAPDVTEPAPVDPFGTRAVVAVDRPANLPGMGDMHVHLVAVGSVGIEVFLERPASPEFQRNGELFAVDNTGKLHRLHGGGGGMAGAVFMEHYTLGEGVGPDVTSLTLLGMAYPDGNSAPVPKEQQGLVVQLP